MQESRAQPETAADALHESLAASVRDALGASPRWLHGVVWSGLAPAGLTTVDTAVREGLQDLHWKAAGDALTRFLRGGGPVFTKLGQILATRDDLLPPALARRLERLYDDQPPMSRRELDRRLGLAYPDGLPFEELDRAPLAVGSIGQVHRARLPGGERVVVKLLRPGIAEALERDMRGLRAFADLGLRCLGRTPQRDGVLRMLDDLGRAFAREADLVAEADALEDFGRRLAGSAHVAVPHCHRALCSADVLVQEELAGTPLSALRDDPDAHPQAARRAAHLALSEILSQVFDDGHFHADPHAGNLLWLDDGRLGLIDLGLTATLGERERRIIARAVRALLARDLDATFRLLLELGAAPPDLDLAAYRSEIGAVLARHGPAVLARMSGVGGRGSDTSSGDDARLETMVDELFAATRRHRIVLPESTTLLIKTLVTIEGVARSLDPDIHVGARAVPIVLRSLAPRWLRWGTARRAR